MRTPIGMIGIARADYTVPEPEAGLGQSGSMGCPFRYCIPPLERVNLAEVLELVRDKRYFVLHAPRQTGKTSTLLALRDLLNGGAEGDFRCVYVNVEAAQAVREDVEHAMRIILGELASRARSLGDEFLYSTWPDILATFGGGALGEALTRWCEADSRPLVLLIDEIDTLIGDSLISVLRQLRAGYDRRPGSFPQCVVMCGVCDVRDYRIRSGSENAVVTGGSAFNVRAESLRIGDFTRAEVHALLAQHTAETGQAFTAEALETVWRQTQGQPWLVNALCRRVCFAGEAGRDRSRAITATDIFDAREHLVQSRQVHLDQLADKLQEDRVRRVVGPLLSGADEREFSAHDLEYGLGRGRTDLLVVWPRGGQAHPEAPVARCRRDALPTFQGRRCSGRVRRRLPELPGRACGHEIHKRRQELRPCLSHHHGKPRGPGWRRCNARSMGLRISGVHGVGGFPARTRFSRTVNALHASPMRYRQTDNLRLSSTFTSADALTHPASRCRSTRQEDGRGTPQRDAASPPMAST